MPFIPLSLLHPIPQALPEGGAGGCFSSGGIFWVGRAAQPRAGETPWEGAWSACSSGLVPAASPIAHLRSPPLLQSALQGWRCAEPRGAWSQEVCGARLSLPGAAGIKDTSSAFFFVFHLLRLFVASTVWGCTSRPAPLPLALAELLSIPLAPGERDTACWVWKCCPGLADLHSPLKSLPASSL